MELKVNREYLQRHLFVVLLMTGLGGWFGYDGVIRYPSLSGAELYKSIESAEAPAGTDLEAFKKQKIQTQYGLSALCLLMALVVGARLFRATRLKFTFDETGFVWNGRRFAYSDVKAVDESRWSSKTILGLTLASGEKIVLDGWHHTNVREFHARVAKPSAE